LTFHRSIINTS